MPLSMIVGVSERAGEPSENAAGTERALGSPEPQETVSSAEVDSALLADVSKAPTIRPPPAPTNIPFGVASSPPSSGVGIAAHGGSGFTSVIRHLSLAGWLRWIHSNRSDAELRVRTPDGGSGNIWCSAGRIVDAKWGALTAEDALHEMLRLVSGSVTIDFDRVDRQPRITRPTHELLRISEAGAGRIGHLSQAEAAPPAWPAGVARDRPFRNSFSAPLAELPPASSQRPAPELFRNARGVYFAGGLSLAALILAAFAFGRIQASSEAGSKAPAEERAQQIKSGLLPPASPPRAETAAPAVPATRRDLPVIPFVAIEVEPAHAEIWLDRALVGLGRLELAPISDGAMHELRFVAPGHETRTLFFLDAPPPGRVVLERATQHGARAVDGAQTGSAANEPAPVVSSEVGSDEREPVKRGRRRRAPLPPTPEAAEPPAEHAPPVAASTQVKKSMQIEVIEAPTPRVQVLD